MQKAIKNISEQNDLGTRFGSNVDVHQQDFMEESSCFYSSFVDFCLLAAQSIDLKVPHQANKNWHWTTIHKVMKHVKNLEDTLCKRKTMGGSPFPVVVVPPM